MDEQHQSVQAHWERLGDGAFADELMGDPRGAFLQDVVCMAYIAQANAGRC